MIMNLANDIHLGYAFNSFIPNEYNDSTPNDIIPLLQNGLGPQIVEITVVQNENTFDEMTHNNEDLDLNIPLK